MPLLCEPEKSDTSDVYRLLVGAVVPRPIAWVTTLNDAGVVNLAPFSFFTIASREPATLAVSIAGTDNPAKATKDTLANIRSSGQLVVNISSERLVGQVQRSSAELPAGVSELEAAGLTPRPPVTVAVPSVAESGIAFECTLWQEIPLGRDTLVLARVHLIIVEDAVLGDDGRIAPELLRPLGRMSGPRFCTNLPECTIDAPRDPDGGPAR